MFNNQFTDKADKFTSELNALADSAKLTKMFEAKTFKEQNKSIFLASLVLGVLCALVSAITSFSFVFFFFLRSFVALPNWLAVGISVIIGLSIVTILEIVKRGALLAFAKNALQYGKYTGYLGLIFVISMAMSVAMSYFGAKMLPEMATPRAVIVNVDSINAIYKKEISEVTTLNTYKANNTLTKSGAAAVALLQLERTKEIETLKAANAANAAKSENKIVGLELTFTTISVVNEILLLLCVLFGIYYNFKSYVEMLSLASPKNAPHGSQNEPTSERMESIEMIPHTATGAAQRHKIGFTALPANKVCDKCEMGYTSNHKKQRFCSDACRFTYHREQNAKASQNVK